MPQLKGTLRFTALPSPYIALEQVRASYEHLVVARGTNDLHEIGKALSSLERDVVAAQRAVYKTSDTKNAELRKLLGMPDWD